MPYLSSKYFDSLAQSLIKPHDNLSFKQVSARKLKNLKQKNNVGGIGITTGLYIKPPKIDRHTIYLLKSLPNYQKASILLHEYGHFLCSISACECVLNENTVLSELHAILYELDNLMKLQLHDSLVCCIKSVCHYCFWAECGEMNDYYYDIASRIYETDLWRQACHCISYEIKKWSDKPRFHEYILPMVEFAL